LTCLFLFKRYATANNPAIASSASNAGCVGVGVVIIVGEGLDVGVCLGVGVEDRDSKITDTLVILSAEIIISFD